MTSHAAIKFGGGGGGAAASREPCKSSFERGFRVQGLGFRVLGFRV